MPKSPSPSSRSSRRHSPLTSDGRGSTSNHNSMQGWVGMCDQFQETDELLDMMTSEDHFQAMEEPSLQASPYHSEMYASQLRGRSEDHFDSLNAETNEAVAASIQNPTILLNDGEFVAPLWPQGTATNIDYGSASGFMESMCSQGKASLPNDLSEPYTGPPIDADAITADVIRGVTHGQVLKIAEECGKNLIASRNGWGFERAPENTTHQASAEDTNVDNLQWQFCPSMNLPDGSSAQSATWLETSDLQPSASATPDCIGQPRDIAVLPLDVSDTLVPEDKGWFPAWPIVDGTMSRSYDARSVCSQPSRTGSAQELNWRESASGLGDGRPLEHPCLWMPVPMTVATAYGTNYGEPSPIFEGSETCYACLQEALNGNQFTDTLLPAGSMINSSNSTVCLVNMNLTACPGYEWTETTASSAVETDGAYMVGGVGSGDRGESGEQATVVHSTVHWTPPC